MVSRAMTVSDKIMSKAPLGALKFLRRAIKTWYFATENTLRQLKVMFVHAKGTKILLWALQITSKDVQVLDHIMSVDIPLHSNQVGNILDLGNFS
ncbi:hypothetical protein EDC94DRAFT_182524 [Helicostylum pulchrum]|nr:hypothetical protein EDC94DRAFT_182524 [Helicostylum pulchrum]